MQGNAIEFSVFMEGAMKQFVIPVYQRNYDWRIGNCDQLFSDLVKLTKNKEKKHFFGSIVTAVADDHGKNRLVIDGQQRITTISLLLLSAIKATRDKKLHIDDEMNIERALDIFLFTKHGSIEPKMKLIPIESDMEAYKHIYDADDDKNMVIDSKMTRNYKHFYELLTKVPQPVTFDELLNAIERLNIIDISLGKDDDPQLIFESLNSTGLSLTGADQIRNYLLMSLSNEEQQYCFKNYWRKIEEATQNDPTMFFRDYLSIKQQRQAHVNLTNLYIEWKSYMTGRDRKEEMSEMCKYSEYYDKIKKANLSTKKLSEKMSHICNLETDIANVFFMQFLKYADDNNLPEGEIYNVIDVIENYMARRIICNLPTNALTQVFCSIHRDVLKSIEEYNAKSIPLTSSYSDILNYHILRREGSYMMPRDEQFVDDIKTRNVYQMNKPYKMFLFERLENSTPGEKNDVVGDMKKGDATIEHIMPQTLNSDWNEMLGDDREAIKEKYLHTFANLTLTGINSKLSNKAFLVKRDGKEIKGQKEPGYKDSKYRMTHNVINYDKWTPEEMEKRGQDIANTFLKLYPMPTPAFRPLPKPVDETSLADESFNPLNRTIKGFRLFGKEYECRLWVDMMLEVIGIFIEQKPDDIEALYGKDLYFYTSKDVDESICAKIGTDRYVRKNIDNRGKIKCLRYMFDQCEVDQSELVLLLDPLK